jgi:hypothetical protein
MTKRTFWLVWCPENGAPTHKHETKESAGKEAERLARKYRGSTFVVLQSLHECLVDDLRTIEHEITDEVPF